MVRGTANGNSSRRLRGAPVGCSCRRSEKGSKAGPWEEGQGIGCFVGGAFSSSVVRVLALNRFLMLRVDGHS